MTNQESKEFIDQAVQKLRERGWIAEGDLTPSSITEEELEASAKALLEFAGSVPPQIPPDQGGAGKTAPITKESLKDIKNPIERIKAREALNSLV